MFVAYADLSSLQAFVLFRMLIHRFRMQSPQNDTDAEFAMDEVWVSQYRKPLDSSYKALLCSKMSNMDLQSCFLDICHSIFASGFLLLKQ